MRKRVLLAFLLLMFALTAAEGCGTDFYVRKGASGSNNGTDWNNAWNEMNQINWSSVACGDTIWLAGNNGGTPYSTNLTLNKSCTSSTVVNVNRVLSTDSVPTAAAGWNSSYDSQVVISGAEIVLAAGAYYTINGRLGTVAGNNFGISVRATGSSGGNTLDGAASGSLSNIIVSYVEFYGPPCVTAGTCTSNADGFNVASSSSNTVKNLLLDHLWIHRFAESIRTSNWSGGAIQYSEIDTTGSTPAEHEDLMYSYPSTNMTWHHNIIWGSPNDGIFHEYGGAVNLRFYDNIYYHSGAWTICFKNDGNTYGPVFIYNNLFENDGTFGDYQPSYMGDARGGVNLAPGSEIANNIFYNSYNQYAPNDSNHNAYSTGAGSETGGVSYAPGKPLNSFKGFVNMDSSNPAAADFHLTAAGQALFVGKGKNLGAPYNVDFDGNTRPATGAWTIGPFEYSGTQAQAPASADQSCCRGTRSTTRMSAEPMPEPRKDDACHRNFLLGENPKGSSLAFFQALDVRN